MIILHEVPAKPLSREGERARRRGETGFVSTSGKLYLVDM